MSMERLGDMEPLNIRFNGKDHVELPHQMHMRYIKQHLQNRNMSWVQFGTYINSPEYPLSGTRKQKLAKTAMALDKDPGYLEGIVRHMEGK